MEVLRYIAIDDSPAKKPAGAATTSGLFVPTTPRRRQLASLIKKQIISQLFDIIYKQRKFIP